MLAARWLEHPLGYQLAQAVLYKAGMRTAYVREHVKAKPGDKVLDLGCGPGTILEQLPAVDYTGFDFNEGYIARARARYGRRGRFTALRIGETLPIETGSFDVAMANAVLHHLDDAEAGQLLGTAHAALKPGGRFVSLDGCFLTGQHPVARFLLEWDRGRHVRTREGYERLIRRWFPRVEAHLRRDMIRVPYDLIIFECMK